MIKRTDMDRELLKQNEKVIDSWASLIDDRIRVYYKGRSFTFMVKGRPYPDEVVIKRLTEQAAAAGWELKFLPVVVSESYEYEYTSWWGRKKTGLSYRRVKVADVTVKPGSPPITVTYVSGGGGGGNFTSGTTFTNPIPQIRSSFDKPTDSEYDPDRYLYE